MVELIVVQAVLLSQSHHHHHNPMEPVSALFETLQSLLLPPNRNHIEPYTIEKFFSKTVGDPR